jgi:hypothetical protein
VCIRTSSVSITTGTRVVPSTNLDYFYLRFLAMEPSKFLRFGIFTTSLSTNNLLPVVVTTYKYSTCIFYEFACCYCTTSTMGSKVVLGHAFRQLAFRRIVSCKGES